MWSDESPCLKHASSSNLPRYVAYWDGERVVSVEVYEVCGDGFTRSFMPKNGSGSIGLFGLPCEISNIPGHIEDIFNVRKKR